MFLINYTIVLIVYIQTSIETLSNRSKLLYQHENSILYDEPTIKLHSLISC